MEKRLKVLLAEDNADQLVSLAELLGDEGFEVRAVLNTENILANAAAFKPDIYLLDIGMPGCDGYETAKKLRELYGPGPLLIALTAYARTVDRARALKAGFDLHVAKPFEFAELAALMRDMRSRSPADRRLGQPPIGE